MAWQIVLYALASISPILELRASIPLLSLATSPENAFLIAVLVNFLAFFIGMFFLEVIHHKLLKWNWYKKKFEKRREKIIKKYHKKIEKYGYWFILLFVGIPLPFSGSYTGTLICWVFEMKKDKSFLFVSLGAILAGIMVYLGVKGAISLFLLV